MPIRQKRRKSYKDEGKKLPGLAVFFIRFYKPLAAIVCVVIFFFVYNVYIVDRSMLDIQFALEQTAKAQTLSDIQGLDMILDTSVMKELTVRPKQLNNMQNLSMILDATVLKELSSQKIDSQSLINLDFATNITKGAQVLNQAKDVKFALAEVLDKKKKSRNPVLLALDDVNNKIIKAGASVKNSFRKSASKESVITDLDEKIIDGARELQTKGDLEGAIKIYEDAIKQVPQYEGIEKLRLGFIYQSLDNFNRAKVLYEQVARNAPEDEIVSFAQRLLDNLKNIVDLNNKKKFLEESISKEAQTDKLQAMYYELGNVNGMIRSFEPACAAYNKVIELGPGTEIAKKAKFNLAFIYKMQSKYSDSEKIFSQLSQDAPQSDLAADSNYWVADNLRSQGKYDEAIQKFQEVAQQYKNRPELSAVSAFRAGYVCLYDVKDPDKAKTLFNTLKTDFSDSQIASYSDVNVSTDIGNVYRDEGFKLVLDGKPEEAKAKFNEAIKLNPRDAFSYAGLGAASGLLRELQEALQKSQEAVRLAPQNSYANANLGFIYMLNSDYKHAQESYEKAIQLNPKYADVLYNLGWIYQSQGFFDKAVTVYNEAIKYKPGLAVAYNNLGVCYWNIDKIDAASKEFTRAVQLDSNLADAHYNLAMAHFLFGRLKQAEAEISKALQLTDNIEDAKGLLILIRQKMQEEGK